MRYGNNTPKIGDLVFTTKFIDVNKHLLRVDRGTSTKRYEVISTDFAQRTLRYAVSFGDGPSPDGYGIREEVQMFTAPAWAFKREDWGKIVESALVWRTDNFGEKGEWHYIENVEQCNHRNFIIS